jgi:hypothetical protein
MRILLKTLGGVALMLLGVFILMYPIELMDPIKPLFREPIDFIVDIALVVGGMVLFVKGGE